MTIIGQVARAGIRAAQNHDRQPPNGQPTVRPGAAGTVAVQEGKVITGTPPRTTARPVDGALLWCYVRRYLSHYVAFRTEAELDRATAWVFHACARRRGEMGMGPLIWNATPRLLIKSRKRGAGKSTLLDLMVYLTGSRRGKTPRITPARLAQIIGQAHEAVFVDEGRLVFGAGARHEDLQACLLVGYTPNGSYEVSKTSLSVFGPVAIATKESLITEASKAVDGDESSLGDLLDRCLTVTLTASDFPLPEVGKRARAEGEVLARALVAWTDTYRDDLEQAAEDIADGDLEAARERARRGERATETPRALQIGRPLRAIGRVIDQQVTAEACREGRPDPEPQCEATILACLGNQAEDIMSELEELSAGWGDGHFTGDEEDEDAPQAVSEPQPAPAPHPAPRTATPAPPAEPPSAPPVASYAAGYTVTRPGEDPDPHPFDDPFPTLEAAQEACQGSADETFAEEPLSWHPVRETGLNGGSTVRTWTAVLQPGGPGSTRTQYTVSTMEK